jgi:FAD synthetase
MRVLVFGTFDDLHPGHLHFLRQAEALGEVSVVIARDSNVLRIKGREALQSEQERMRAIEKVFPSMNVILGDPEDFLHPVREIKPDMILLGYDQHLPPGVQESDLPCQVERAVAFEPEVHKSSIRRGSGEER